MTVLVSNKNQTRTLSLSLIIYSGAHSSVFTWKFAQCMHVRYPIIYIRNLLKMIFMNIKIRLHRKKNMGHSNVWCSIVQFSRDIAKHWNLKVHSWQSNWEDFAWPVSFSRQLNSSWVQKLQLKVFLWLRKRHFFSGNRLI